MIHKNMPYFFYHSKKAHCFFLLVGSKFVFYKISICIDCITYVQRNIRPTILQTYLHVGFPILPMNGIQLKKVSVSDLCVPVIHFLVLQVVCRPFVIGRMQCICRSDKQLQQVGFTFIRPSQCVHLTYKSICIRLKMCLQPVQRSLGQQQY